MQKFVVIFCLLFLHACSTTYSLRETVNISQQGFLTLSDAPTVLKNHSATQLFSIRYQNSSHQFILSSEFKTHKISLVAVTLQGIPLFDLVFQKDKHLESQQYIPVDISPEYIVADMQLVLWPIDTLKQHIIGLTIVDMEKDGNRKRVLLYENQPVITISYQTDNVLFEHHQRKYQFNLVNIE